VSNEKRRHNALPDGYKLHWYEILPRQDATE